MKLFEAKKPRSSSIEEDFSALSVTLSIMNPIPFLLNLLLDFPIILLCLSCLLLRNILLPFLWLLGLLILPLQRSFLSLILLVKCIKILSLWLFLLMNSIGIENLNLNMLVFSTLSFFFKSHLFKGLLGNDMYPLYWTN